MKKVILYFCYCVILNVLSASHVLAQNKGRQKVAAPKVQIKLPKDTSLVRKAKAGDADAMAFVGKCYYFGEGGVEENEPEAFRWFNKSALKGSPYGLCYRGLCYTRGIGVPKTNANYNKGEEQMKKAYKMFWERAQQGDSVAECYVGLCHIEEWGTNEDYNEGIKWLVKSGRKGYPEAMYELAEELRETRGIKDKNTFGWYLLAAKNGIDEASERVGDCYLYGYGTDKNVQEAIKWYLMCNSHLKLGLLYENGEYVAKDIEQAIEWYKKASEDNNYMALEKLGCFYRDGYGVDRSYDMAIKYFSRAAKLNSEANSYLREMRAKGKAYYDKQPKRSTTSGYDLSDDDAFSKLVLSMNWDELPADMKKTIQKEFKKEKIKEWGIERATAVANHLVEIGFTEEQIRISQGFVFDKSFIDLPNGQVEVMSYPHCVYFLLNDSLFGMIWSNGVQVGDVKLIESCKKKGNIVITKGNK